MNFKHRSAARWFVTCLIFALVLTPVLSYANWLDTWYSSRTSSGPTYYQGQQRGYWTPGSFNTRVQVDTINPISVSPPYFKAGCGGISAFGGGVALMNFDYLVRKLQGILSSAAGVAFDMALKVLCPECTEAIKSIEAIANQLNGLSLNSCTAGKALVSVAADAVDPGESNKAISDRMAEYSQQNGIDDSYEAFSRQADSAGNAINTLITQFGGSSAGPPGDTTTPQGSGTELLLSGCDAQFISIFATKGSLLKNIASAQGVSDDVTALVRGSLGDFYLIADQSKVVPIPACSGVDSSLTDIVDGVSYTRGPGLSDACTQIAASGSITLRQKVLNDLQSIADTIKARSTLTPIQQIFIQNSPLPMLLILKSAIGRQDENVVIGMMADITAKAMASRFITDTQGALYRMLQYAEMAKAQGGGSTNTCKVEITQNALEGAKKMQERLTNWQVSVKEQLSLAYSEYETLINIVQSHQRMNSTFYQGLSKRFSQSVTDRTMRAF